MEQKPIFECFMESQSRLFVSSPFCVYESNLNPNVNMNILNFYATVL